MDQPVPDITHADVVRVVRRDFPADQYDAVMAMLQEYGDEDWQHGGDRVRLAVLKLANGNLDALRQAIETAKCDFRDVLTVAEYPEYLKTVPPGASVLDTNVQDVIKRDWLQYQRWLKDGLSNQ